MRTGKRLGTGLCGRSIRRLGQSQRSDREKPLSQRTADQLVKRNVTVQNSPERRLSGILFLRQYEVLNSTWGRRKIFYGKEIDVEVKEDYMFYISVS